MKIVNSVSRLVLIGMALMLCLAACAPIGTQDVEPSEVLKPAAEAMQEQDVSVSHTRDKHITETETGLSTETLSEGLQEETVVYISIGCQKATDAGVAGAPESGWILDKKEVELQDGDTAWDILSRVGKENGIAVAKQGSGATVFVTGIRGVTAIDSKSGWMYSVNGDYVMTGAGNCTVKSGDVVRWRYTMDGGNDL